MTTRTRLNAELATQRYTRRHAREIVTAMLGNNSGTVVAATDTRWYNIRLHGDPNQVVRAWNTGFVPPVPNLPVDVEIVKANGITDYQIIGVSLNRGVVADVNAGATGSHALQHQRRDFNTGGFDPLDIYGRAIVQLRARAQATPDMTLYVEAGWYSVAGIATYFAGGNSPAFTAPVSGFRCDLLYLNNAGTLQIVTGTAIPFGTPARPAQPSANDLPLAYVYLTAATTSVTEYLIEDGRMVFGGAGGGVGAHTIGSHSDALIAALADGEVLTWDAGAGKWVNALSTYDADRLTLGTISTITDDAKYNAWPSVCRMANGNLLTVYTKGNGHNTDTSGTIVGRISSDSGATWGAEFTIASDGANGCINASCTSLSGGRVIVVYNLFNGAIDPPDCIRVKYSDNYGVAWSAAYSVNTSPTTQVAPIGQVVELANGDVLLPFYGLSVGDVKWNAYHIKSTDTGATFSTETLIADGDADGRDYFEPTLTLLDNGDLLCLLRTTTGAGNTYQTKSTDSGATWGARTIAFAGYGAPNCIQSSWGRLFVVERQNADAKTILWDSLDRGVTWNGPLVLDDTVYTEMEYGCPVELADGRILVIYSVQPTAAITNADVKQVYLSDATVGLNADKLDGKHASEFADSAHTHTHASTTGKTANDHHNQSHILGAGGDHSDAPANQADGFVKRNAANGAWEEVPYGSTSNTVAQGDHTHAGGGGGHLHGLDRWVADGGATFNLLDLAEYVDAVFDNGSAVDPITITLSADLSQIVFDSAPTPGHILTAEYVVAGA